MWGLAAIVGAGVAWAGWWLLDKLGVGLPPCSELRRRDESGRCIDGAGQPAVNLASEKGRLRGQPAKGLDPANLRPSPEFLRRLEECGVTAEDLTIANRWTARFVGDVQPLRDRLEQMQQIVPVTEWPPAAARVWCAFK